MFSKPIRIKIAFLVTCCLVTYCASMDAARCNDVDFARDIRPILSDTCFTCHGPDGGTRVSALRLDTKQGLFSKFDEGSVVVPGDASASQLLQRVTAFDPDRRMPPADSGRELTAQQIDLLQRWIVEGAEWDGHWSFVVPQRPGLPPVKNAAWCRNEIDVFVLARIEAAGLTPNESADRSTLIRRATLDITGLPPTLEEIEAFVNDASPNAWEQVVDRLLQSPKYGERLAVDWLDAARYADTSGYQNDGPRDMWRWRDWVIDAFNANMPYDQFTIEQLAGDLLPNPTLNQQLATGFNRNHRGNAEGGIIPEEYQVEYVVDRVDTTSTVWLGLTMGCARCHDHKYDPISQREFYQLFAFFNNIPENGRAIKEGNSPPYIKAPTPAMQRDLSKHDAKIRVANSKVEQLSLELQRQQLDWEGSLRAQELREQTDASGDWSLSHGLLHRFRLDGSLEDSLRKTDGTPHDSHDPPDERAANYGTGIGQQALSCDGSRSWELGDVADFGYFDEFTIAAWIEPAEDSGTIVSRMVPEQEGSGYSLHLQDGHLQVNLVKRWLDDSIRVSSRDKLRLHAWQHITVSYDGSRRADGIRAYVDGQEIALEVLYDGINQSFAVDEPLRVGGGQSNFTGLTGDLRVFGRVLSEREVSIIAVPESVREILRIEVHSRNRAQKDKLAAYFLDVEAAEEIRDAHQRLRIAIEQRKRFYDSIPTVMVMQEMRSPRPTHILLRGQYDVRGELVDRGVPSMLLPASGRPPQDRLGLAQWIVSAENPLTARVTVNRIWQSIFGTGIVKTAEDFGAQGALPSHPLLLDYLATEFIRSGWDLKALYRKILTSATYQQSALGSPVKQQIDPENRLLARAPRLRLSAETVRDQVLAISGLLCSEIGGPSVRPYQPEGLWKEIASTTEYHQSTGADLYRRSLYTYWKRTVAPPTMVALDATSRESCIVKRSRTNTPLQALALMNDVTFVEAARVLAERLLREGGAEVDAKLSLAVRLALGRPPNSEEFAVLQAFYDNNLEEFTLDQDAADKLIVFGDSVPAGVFNSPELAAWTATISLILNLDEFVNKE